MRMLDIGWHLDRFSAFSGQERRDGRRERGRATDATDSCMAGPDMRETSQCCVYSHTQVAKCAGPHHEGFALHNGRGNVPRLTALCVNPSK